MKIYIVTGTSVMSPLAFFREVDAMGRVEPLIELDRDPQVVLRTLRTRGEVSGEGWAVYCRELR